jgi:endonuclease YncB( thermonuclease family)
LIHVGFECRRVACCASASWHANLGWRRSRLCAPSRPVQCRDTGRIGGTGQRHRRRHPGIRGERIRLWGIDTPESSQLCRAEDSRVYHCGAKAANGLDAFIAGRPVFCTPLSQDQYGRTVASCSVNGIDLGEWLVRNGLALDRPQYSKGRYAAVPRVPPRAGQSHELFR